MKNLLIFVLILSFGCSTEPADPVFGNWKEVNLTDDFGDETGKTALQATFTGTLKNSAVTNEKCFGVFSISEGLLAVNLFDYYLETPAAMPRKYDPVYVVIKDQQGEVNQVTLASIKNTAIDLDRELIKLMTKEAGKVKMIFTVRPEVGGESEYSFVIDTNGLFSTSE